MTINGVIIDPAFVGMILAIGGVIWNMMRMSGRFATLELKVDTMWDLQWKRAASEAVKAGIATRNSPVIINDEAKGWAEPLLPAMRDFYLTLGRRMSDGDLMLEIVRRFDDDIITQICIPHGLSEGACILLIKQALEDAYGEKK